LPALATPPESTFTKGEEEKRPIPVANAGSCRRTSVIRFYVRRLVAACNSPGNAQQKFTIIPVLLYGKHLLYTSAKKHPEQGIIFCNLVTDFKRL